MPQKRKPNAQWNWEHGEEPKGTAKETTAFLEEIASAVEAINLRGGIITHGPIRIKGKPGKNGCKPHVRIYFRTTGSRTRRLQRDDPRFDALIPQADYEN